MKLRGNEALCLVVGFLIGLLFTYNMTIGIVDRKSGELLAGNGQDSRDTYKEARSSAASQPQRQQFSSFFEDPCQEVDLPSTSEFFRYLNSVTLPCKEKVMFGGIELPKGLDGDKFVCMDPPYKLTGPNCTVFSFGINNEWSFDDAMDRLGCKVYAFDPTMGKPSHDRSPNIKFYNIGVHGEDGTIEIRKRKAQVLTYKSIVKLTSTENKTIDYLKMDVEGSEIPFFEEAFRDSSDLLKRVKQIGVEIHGSGESPNQRIKTYWRHFQKLECLGFRLMHMNPNRPNLYVKKGNTYSCCYEVVWVMDPSKA